MKKILSLLVVSIFLLSPINVYAVTSNNIADKQKIINDWLKLRDMKLVPFTTDLIQMAKSSTGISNEVLVGLLPYSSDLLDSSKALMMMMAIGKDSNNPGNAAFIIIAYVEDLKASKENSLAVINGLLTHPNIGAGVALKIKEMKDLIHEYQVLLEKTKQVFQADITVPGSAGQG